MKKQHFVTKLMSHGIGFAMTFLAIVGMAVVFALGLILVLLSAFFDRLLN